MLSFGAHSPFPNLLHGMHRGCHTWRPSLKSPQHPHLATQGGRNQTSAQAVTPGPHLGAALRFCLKHHCPDLAWLSYTIVLIHLRQLFWIVSFDPYKTLEESSCYYPRAKDGETEVEKLARGPYRCSGCFTHSICQNRSAHPRPPLGWGAGQAGQVKESVLLGAACKLRWGEWGHTHPGSLPPSWDHRGVLSTPQAGASGHKGNLPDEAPLGLSLLPHFPTPQLLLPDTIPQINHFLRLSSWRTSHTEGESGFRCESATSTTLPGQSRDTTKVISMHNIKKVAGARSRCIFPPIQLLPWSPKKKKNAKDQGSKKNTRNHSGQNKVPEPLGGISSPEEKEKAPSPMTPTSLPVNCPQYPS